MSGALGEVSGLGEVLGGRSRGIGEVTGRSWGVGEVLGVGGGVVGS